MRHEGEAGKRRRKEKAESEDIEMREGEGAKKNRNSVSFPNDSTRSLSFPSLICASEGSRISGKMEQGARSKRAREGGEGRFREKKLALRQRQSGSWTRFSLACRRRRREKLSNPFRQQPRVVRPMIRIHRFFSRARRYCRRVDRNSGAKARSERERKGASEPGPKRRAKNERSLGDDGSRRKESSRKLFSVLSSRARRERSCDCLSLDRGCAKTFCVPSRETSAEDVDRKTRAKGRGEHAGTKEARVSCRNEVVEKSQALSPLCSPLPLRSLDHVSNQTHHPGSVMLSCRSKAGKMSRQNKASRRRKEGRKSRERENAATGRREEKMGGSEREPAGGFLSSSRPREEFLGLSFEEDFRVPRFFFFARPRGSLMTTTRERKRGWRRSWDIGIARRRG